MAASLQSENSLLKKLDLSINPLGNSGVTLLSTGLSNANCRLETLRLANCELTSDACQPLTMVLQSSCSHLKKLDLTNNDLTDSGLRKLCEALGHNIQSCKLEVLMLSGCLISHIGFGFIASVLSTSQLKELDLSYNHPGRAGKILSKLSSSKLKVNVESCSEVRMKKGFKKYGCELTLDLNTAHMSVYVNEEMKMAKYVEVKQPYPDHPSRFDCDRQVLCTEPLCGRCYWEVKCKGYCVVGVAYQSISRNGSSELGYNELSWCLECNNNMLRVIHNKMPYARSTFQSNRIGIYVDKNAGILSFYSLLPESMEHLHTFHCTFTEPLYAAFGVCRENATISLCQI